MTTRLEGLSIGLDLDTLKLDRGLPGLKDKLKTLNSEMKLNMSAFDRGDQSLDKYQTRLDGLNKKLEVQKTVTKEAKAEYEKMVKEHGEGSKEAEKAAREYNNQAAELNNLERYVKNVTDEMKQFQKQQKIQNSTLYKTGDSFINFGNGLKSISDKAKGLGQSLTQKITKPAVGAASALAGVALVKGFGRLVGIDTARAKLQGLGHDAEGVEKIMESALDSVRGTSFGMDEAATTAANAVAAGVKEGKTLTRYLSLTGDAAAIAGASMSDMGAILNKVKTSNKAYNGELQQLSDRGLPVYQWLAKEAGVAADKVFDMASDGKISSEMLMNAIEKNIGGAAKKMGETSFTAGLANMWAAVGRIGASFLDAGGKGGGFFSTLKPLIADFTARIDTMGDFAEKAGVKFGEMFTGFIDKVKSVKSWFDSLSPSMQNIIKKAALIGGALAISIGPALTVFGTVGGHVANISTRLGKLMKKIAEAGGVLKWLRGIFAAFTGPVGLTIAAVAGLTTAFVVAYKKFEPFRNVVNGIKDAFVKAYQSIKEFLTTNKQLLFFADLIKSSFLGTAKLIGGFFKDVSKIIAYHFKELKQVFQLYADFGKTIISAFKAIFKGDFKKGFSLFKEAFVNAFQGALNIIKGRLNFFDDLIGKKIRGWIAKFGNWIDGIRKKSAVFNAVIGGISKAFSNYIADFKAVFSTLTNHFKSYVAGWKSIFKGDFKGAFVHFKDGIVNLFKGLTTIVKNRMSQIKTDIIESVKTWGPALVKWIAGSAKSLGSGFKKWGAASLTWIKNLKDNTIERLSGWKKAIIDWVASKAKDIGEGFANWKETFASNFSESKDAILDWMDTLPGLIKAKLSKWRDAFTDWLIKQQEENKRQYGEWKDQLFEWIQSTGKNIGKKFEIWKDSIKEWFKKFQGSNGFSFKEWFKKVGQSVVDFKDKLIEKFNTWKDGIKDWFKGLGKEAEPEKAGKEIVKNVVKGATGKKKDWTENIGAIILDGLKYIAIAVFVIALSIGRELIKRIISGITSVKGKFDEILGNLLGALKIKLGEMVKATIEKWNHIKVKTSEFLTKWRENFSNVVKNIVDFVKKRFSGMGESTKNIFNKIRELTMIIWEGVKKRITDPVKSAVDTAKLRFSAARDSIRNIFDKIKENAKNSWDSIKKRIINPVKSAVSSIRDRFTNMRQTIADIFKKTKDKVGDYVSSMVKTVKGMPGRMAKGIKDMGYKLYDSAKGVANRLVKGLGKGVNGVIGGVNWVLDRIGLKDKRLDPWEVPKYAKGTDGHPYNGPAIVGDGGMRELVQTPDGQTFLSPNRATLVNLPKGTSVLSGPETKELMSMFPAYKNGIGKTLKDKVKAAGSKIKNFALDVWDYVSKPKKLMKKVWDKFVPNMGLTGIHSTIAKGAIKMVKNHALEWVKGQMPELAVVNGFRFGAPFRRTSGYGMRDGRLHKGVDWAAPTGTPIPSLTGGKVISAGFGVRGSGFGGYGNYVLIQGANGMSYLYAHNSKNNVKKGDTVRKGQVIGLVGSTGDSTGPHVHFEVRRNGKAINPEANSGGGSVSGNVKKWIAAGMARAGVSGADWMNGLAWIIQRESSGNPRAVGAMTSSGTAKGLMQLKDFNISGNPFDPVNNIFHGIRYIKNRYGSIGKAVSFWKRNNWYATGGRIKNPGIYGLAEGGWPEYVIPTDPKRRTDAMKLLALAGREISGNKRPHQLPNVGGNNESNELLEATLEQNKLLQKSNELLMAILQKNQTITMKNRVVGEVMDEEQATRIKLSGRVAY